MKKYTICIYGAASDNIEDIFKKQGEELGKEIARRGHTLLFGAGSNGLMGACARGAESLGGNIIGVMPFFMDEYEGIYRKCTDLIITETMAERKSIMEERSDAFVITPGGIGTLDEFFQILTLVDLDRKKAPIIFYNINGYYTPIIEFIENGIEKGFIRPEVRRFYQVKTTASGVVEAIEESLQ